jgi:aryl-alcohol dehydrogenase-like predicted oxidoreductase
VTGRAGRRQDGGRESLRPRGLGNPFAKKSLQIRCPHRGSSKRSEPGLPWRSRGMQFCLQEEGVPTTISGAARGAEVEANVRTTETPIDQELLAEARAIFAPVKDVTWPSGTWVD